MESLKQTYKINALPDEVFNSITNPVAIELWSGYPANIQPVPGTEFELWEGDISGKIIDVEPNKKLIQEWYFGDQNEQSLVSIYLRQKGNSTVVELEHVNIPDEEFENIKEGWSKYFWGAIQEFFK
ncbi:MAG: ATPase [Bacteroidales bacterium]|nr:ATPase [Bacteroidales bacterium]